MILQIESSVFDDRYSGALKFFSNLGINNYAYFDFKLNDLKGCSELSEDTIQEWELLDDVYTRDSASFEMTNRVVVVAKQQECDLDKTPPVVDIESAKRLLTTPFEIWLENARNDKNFLMCALGRNIRGRLDEQNEQGRLRFDGKGGVGELKKNLMVNNDRLKERAKIFVIIDSDSDSPYTPGRDNQEVISLCREKGIYNHCLERRMIENYIPHEYEIAKRERYDADSPIVQKWKIYRSFTLDQRFCFHLKKGFKYQSYHPDLYSGVSREDKDTLENGFGQNIADFFSDLEQREVIHQEMKAHDETSELENIADKIQKVTRLPK